MAKIEEKTTLQLTSAEIDKLDNAWDCISDIQSLLSARGMKICDSRQKDINITCDTLEDILDIFNILLSADCHPLMLEKDEYDV